MISFNDSFFVFFNSYSHRIFFFDPCWHTKSCRPVLAVIIETLNTYKISPIIIRFLEHAMSMWEIKSTLRHDNGVLEVPNVKIKRGIFQGDTLSSKSTATNKRCIARKLFIFWNSVFFYLLAYYLRLFHAKFQHLKPSSLASILFWKVPQIHQNMGILTWNKGV